MSRTRWLPRDTLSELIGFQQRCGANLFVTSRFDPKVTSKFDRSVWQEIQADRGDVEIYLEGHIEELEGSSNWTEQIKRDIKTGISHAVDGMFLLAHLYLLSLEDKTTISEVRTALKQFQRQKPGSTQEQNLEVLSQAYDVTMSRIDKQISGFRQLARKALSWITCAKRPLTTVELLHALAVKTGDVELDWDNLQTIERIVSVCMGMITVDEASGIIRLAHYTTQEYLERVQNRWLPDAQNYITTTCLTYLSFTVFETNCQTRDGLQRRLRSNPLYEYVAHNWGHHARESRACSREIEDFMNRRPQVQSSIEVLVLPEQDYQKPGVHPAQGMTRLHLAAYFGIDVAIKFLSSIDPPDLKDASHRTPLMYAAQNGHQAFVKQLLAKPNSEKVFAKLLSRHKTTINAKDNEGQAALMYVIFDGHTAVVQELAANGATLNYTDDWGYAPLKHAVKDGHLGIVRELLANGASVHFRDGNGHTLLSDAIDRGHVDIAKELLANGVSVNQKDGAGNSPLFLACWDGYHSLVKDLLARGATAHVQDLLGQTPLSAAVSHGYTDMVKDLLANGASVGLNEPRNEPILIIAAKNGYTDIVRELLAHGASVNLQDCFGETALAFASRRGHADAVKELLAYGASSNRTMHAPRQYAEARASSGNVALVDWSR